MSASLTASTPAPAQPGGRPRGRRVLAIALAAGIALAAAMVASLLGGTDRVRPAFAAGAEVSESPWGSPEVFGVDGSRILDYEHGTTVQLRLPWTGGPVLDAHLGDGSVHLLTVTDAARDGDELVLTVLRDNCSYFHERAIDMFAGIQLTLASGSTTELLFDRPLFVKSPMLAGCPDRTLNRQDDVRSQYSG